MSPIASDTHAMVLAVNWPPHAPAEGQATSSSACSSSSLIAPTACWPTASNTSCTVTSLPWKRPGRMLPPYMNTEGTFSRTMAIMMPGRVLSHPARPTRPSYAWPRMVSSVESAITSRETSELFMP